MTLTSLLPGSCNSYLKLEFSETAYISLSFSLSIDWPSLIETSTLSNLTTLELIGWEVLFSKRKIGESEKS